MVNLSAPKKALARVLSQHLVPSANLRSPQWSDASIQAGLTLKIFEHEQIFTLKQFNSWSWPPTDSPGGSNLFNEGGVLAKLGQGARGPDQEHDRVVLQQA